MTNAEKALARLPPHQRSVGQTCPTCGRAFKDARSYQQHKRYFALMKAMLFHWPESHPMVFANETALRKWLQMKAGHHTTKAIDLYGIPAKKAQLIVQAALDAAEPYSEARVIGQNLVIFSPKSIDYASLGHKAFCELSDGVDAVIRAETGLDPEQVLTETERAA